MPPQRFLLDNDGSNIFHFLSDNIEQDITDAVEECPENVTTYLLCAGAGTYYFPTKAGIVDPRASRLVQAHTEGKDPFRMFLDALRRSGRETFITLRMNDVHDPTDADQWNVPKIRREHPEFIVDIEAAQRGDDDWMVYCLDYSRSEVQDYFLEIIGELVDWYDFDGLQLDWMRFPRHLSGTPDQVWQKRRHITQFTRNVKQLLRPKKIKLAARVPTSLAGCRALGMDLAEWKKLDLMDFIVACPFLSTDFGMPVREMRAEMGDAPVPIYAGFDFGHAPQNHCPESLRAAVTSLYDSGADGIYVFNFPCWQERLVAAPYHWISELHDPRKAAQKPLLFSVPHLRFRKNVDLPYQLPSKISAGKSGEFSLPLPSAVLPVRRSRILIHSAGDIALAVNGELAEELPRKRRSEIFVEFINDGWLGQHRPPKDETRIFRLKPACFRAGENTLRIENLTGKALEICRINVGLW
ncbi:hypothetical protein JXJ21_18405 [candidate division KSB1 bacterium]|nr:hypothetical protein [candidate division KSB1 bacterium]